MIDSAWLRRFVYDELLTHGLPPTINRIAAAAGADAATATSALAGLRIGKTVLVHPRTGEIWMAGPFAAAATPYGISARGLTWWANCAWDMLGVAAIVNEPVRLDASCTDCGDRFTMEIDPARGVESDWVVHFLLPAWQWYDDIGFT